MTLRPLLAYLPWHARDASVRTFSPVLIFLVIAGLPLMTISATKGSSLFDGSRPVQELALQVWSGTASLSITIAAFLVMSQSISTDRDKQHVRFLFAHQVNPVLFYVQRFVVGLAMLVAYFALIAWGYSQVVPVPVLGTVLALLLTCWLVGSLTMLAGALTKAEGILVLGVYLVANVLQQVSVAAGESAPRWVRALAPVLPPVNRMSDYAQAWINGRTVDPSDLVLVIGYAAGMFIAALVLLRRAPLVR